jgi:hypothetical protein
VPGTIHSNGDEAEVVMESTGKGSRSFLGWYIRKYCADTKAKGNGRLSCHWCPKYGDKEGKIVERAPVILQMGVHG